MLAAASSAAERILSSGALYGSSVLFGNNHRRQQAVPATVTMCPSAAASIRLISQENDSYFPPTACQYSRDPRGARTRGRSFRIFRHAVPFFMNESRSVLLLRWLSLRGFERMGARCGADELVQPRIAMTDEIPPSEKKIDRRVWASDILLQGRGRFAPEMFRYSSSEWYPLCWFSTT